jgi:hypothetical protein
VTIQYQVIIDWDGDGSYRYDEAGYLEAVSGLERGREGEDEPIKAGQVTLVLNNMSGRFDPWNEASPLYGKILPRRGIILRVGDDTTEPHVGEPALPLIWFTKGYMHTLFTGTIADPQPSGAQAEARLTLQCEDGWRDVIGIEVSVALQENIRTDEAIGLILDAVGWTGGRRLDVGSDTMRYWWSPKGSAAEAIRDLARSEHGIFFFDRRGNARFVSRANLLTAENAGTIEQVQLDDIVPSAPWQSVRNVIRVTCNPVGLGAEGVIWKLQDPVEVPAGSSVAVWANFVDANNNAAPAQDVVAPVATTDYTANSVADGSGADMTADMSVSAGIYSMSAYLTIHNGHATDPLYPQLLQIRGKPIQTYPTTIVRESTTSQAQYGKLQLDVPLPWQQSVATAIDLAESLRTFRANPRKSVTIRLDTQTPDLWLYELEDRVQLDVPYHGIADTLLLGLMRLSTGATLQELHAEWHLEACDTQAFWLLGVVGASELGVTTWLGY